TISQRLLGTNEIILIHHTNCGMLTFTDDAVKRQIQEDTGIKPRFALEAFPDLDEDVRQSIARIQESPFIPNENVRGFVFDVSSGRLREDEQVVDLQPVGARADRKSTRLNSSHQIISYAVFSLKKKSEQHIHTFFCSLAASQLIARLPMLVGWLAEITDINGHRRLPTRRRHISSLHRLLIIPTI